MFLIRQFNPEIHHRGSLRLRNFDYSTPGAYFITVCAHNRDKVFGMVRNKIMHLNQYGEIVRKTWDDLPNHNPHVSLDAFVIMPDHIHGIIIIRNTPTILGAGSKPAPGMAQPQPKPAPGMAQPQPPTGAGLEPAPTDTGAMCHALPEIIRQFKTFSARRINELRGSAGKPLWQRNFHDRIIWNDRSLNIIREYINKNPEKWR